MNGSIIPRRMVQGHLPKRRVYEDISEYGQCAEA